MLPTFPADEFHRLHERLALTPGPSLGEGPRRDALRDWLAARGIRTRTDAAGNLWVTVIPGDWREAIVFDAHLDVVERGCAARVGRDAKRLTGLGVGDDLAAVTMLALLAVVLAERSCTSASPLELLFSVGEEGLGNLKGTRQVVRDKSVPPYLFVSFDGSFEHYSTIGLGSRRHRVTVSCAGGHSWHDFGQPNAIGELLDFLARVRSARGGLADAGPEPVSFNIGTVTGGEGINSIARSAEATFEFRSPGADQLRRAQEAVDDAARVIGTRPGVALEVTLIGERPAAAPVCPERIDGLVASVLGATLRSQAPVPKSTNINVLLAAGWPAVCLGLCRGGNFHREDEYVELASLPEGWAILDGLCRKLLQA